MHQFLEGRRVPVLVRLFLQLICSVRHRHPSPSDGRVIAVAVVESPATSLKKHLQVCFTELMCLFQNALNLSGVLKNYFYFVVLKKLVFFNCHCLSEV